MPNHKLEFGKSPIEPNPLFRADAPAVPVPLAAAGRNRRVYFYAIPVIQLDLTGHKSEPVRSFVFAFVGICTEVKSQAPPDSLHAMELFSSPMALFYHGGIFLSIALGDFTDCLFGCGGSLAAHWK